MQDFFEIKNNKEVIFFRITCLLAGIVYPLWGFVFTQIYKVNWDPVFYRLIVGFLFLSIFISSYFNSFVKKHIVNLTLITSMILITHYFFLVYQNNNIIEYVSNIMMMVFCVVICLIFTNRFYYIIYSVYILAASLILVFNVDLIHPKPILVASILLTLLIGFGITESHVSTQKALMKERELLILSENKYRTIVENTNDIIYSYTNEGIIDFISGSVIQFGYLPEDLIGKNVFDFIYEEDREYVFNSFKRTIEKFEEFPTQFRIITKYGDIKYIEETGKIEKDLNGNPVRIVGIIRDVSERKKYEDELRIAKETAEKANKAKSEFLANITHELRTPLNGIIGFSELIYEAENDGNKKNIIKMVRHSSNTLLTLINDLLDFSKIEAGNMLISNQVFDLKEVFTELEISFSDYSKMKDVTLNIVVDKDFNTKIVSDKMRIKQILTNLINNAIKFTEKGSVTLEVGISSKDENYIEFKVIDTGIGISDIIKEKLFKMFEQGEYFLNKKYSGTGIGLIIVKKILNLMNGYIDFNSEYGKGSTFIVGFPLEKADYFENEKYVLNKKVLNILIGDNDKNNVSLCQYLVEMRGFKTDVCFDGNSVLEKVEHTKYDLLLLDGDLPQVNGFEISKIIKKISDNINKNSITIIFTSENISNETLSSSGVNDIITKPIKYNNFYNILTKHTN